MILPNFNLNTLKAKAGRSMSFRPVWFTEQVKGQPSLGSERNRWKEKASEDVIEQAVTEHGSFSHMVWAVEWKGKDKLWNIHVTKEYC